MFRRILISGILLSLVLGGAILAGGLTKTEKQIAGFWYNCAEMGGESYAFFPEGEVVSFDHHHPSMTLMIGQWKVKGNKLTFESMDGKQKAVYLIVKKGKKVVSLKNPQDPSGISNLHRNCER